MSAALAPAAAAVAVAEKEVLTPLENLVKEARHMFILAKADGKLDAGEVVQIAVAVAQRVQRVGAALAGAEKKALVLLTLKKGLEAAGGLRTLPGFAEAGEGGVAALEAQLLAAAGAALDIAVAAAAGRLDLRKKESWAACLGACLTVGKGVAAVALKDQPLLKEAVEFAADQAKAAVGAVAPAAALTAPEPLAAQSASPESVAVAVPAGAEDATPPKQSQTEPSPAASAEEAPAPAAAAVEVKFD